METALGQAVEDFRQTFGSSVPFEPQIRVTERGTLRLSWGHSERTFGTRGPARLTQPLPVRWPTDKFMRSLRLPARTQRKVGAFVKRLRSQLASYRDHRAFMGQSWRQIRQLVGTAERLRPAAIA